MTTISLVYPKNLQIFEYIVHDNDAPLNNCLRFVNDTSRSMCSPRKHQRTVFNGHKRKCFLKIQPAVVPNWLFANLYGPVVGKLNDSGMLRSSGLLH